MGKAFKVACRAVRFLDLWTQSANPRQLRILSSFGDNANPALQSTTNVPLLLRSPARLRESPESINQAGIAPYGDARDWPSLSDSVASCDPSQSQPQSARGTSWVEQISMLDPTIPYPEIASRSTLQHRRSSLPPGFQSDHTCGLDAFLNEQRNSTFASERLSASHDNFLGHIGAFLGLHLQSRTSIDLAAATEGSLAACATLIAVVEEIWQKDTNRPDDVARAMVIIQKNLETLAHAAQNLCNASSPLEDLELAKPLQSKDLVTAATACVRSAGDCTAKARNLLNQSGDFQSCSDNLIECLPDAAGLVHAEQSATDQLLNDSLIPRGLSLQQDIEHNSSKAHTEMMDQTKEVVLRLRSKTDVTSTVTIHELECKPSQRPASSPNHRSLQPIVTCNNLPSQTSLATPGTPNSLLKSPWLLSIRKQSLGLSATESTSTYGHSFRNSSCSAISTTSTRATTPERPCQPQVVDPVVLNSFSSIPSMRSAAADDSDIEGEAELLARSYAHELLYNKEGQVLGGTLRALVEKLTNQHSPPDSTFVNTFYLTFRLFTNAVDLTQALIDRFNYVGESKTESMAAHLRIFNFLKGWLESHWSSEYDSNALGQIQDFATTVLQPILPGPGQRLSELADKATQHNITNTATQLVSAVGKITISLDLQHEKQSVPGSLITKGQLNTLRNFQVGVMGCSIADFDALEIARQLTLVQSHTFCAVEADELLNLKWTKNSEAAVNVRTMARFATDLANLIADTILSVDDVRRRAATLKQWIKIGKHCLDMSNFDCLMAIVCSVTSSTILRLRATWDLISHKLKTQLDEMKSVVDMSRNYAVLRQSLQTLESPCLPFIGIYLTDLTFVDAGNPNTRVLPGSEDTVQPIEIINFDKHSRTANVISQLRRYQVPYRLQPVMELQTWLASQMSRVRTSEECCVQSFWRRSLKLEPRATDTDGENRPGTGGGISGSFKLGHKVSKSGLNGVFSKEKREFLFNLGFKSEGEIKNKIAGIS